MLMMMMMWSSIFLLLMSVYTTNVNGFVGSSKYTTMKSTDHFMMTYTEYDTPQAALLESFSDETLSPFMPSPIVDSSSLLIDGSIIESNDDDDDPYGSLLDFDKILEEDSNDQAYLASSIVADPDLPDVQFIKPPKQTSSKKWENYVLSIWNDIDTPQRDGESWVTEMRDAVEQKRGYAIWSSKTDGEIQKEIKKTQASKGLVIPRYVSMIVNAVYLDKICSLREMRKDEELAFGQYRKWMRETKKRLKKDPLPIVKNELAKKWLQRDPNARYSGTLLGKAAKFRKGLGVLVRKTPMTVLEEYTDIFNKAKNATTAAEKMRSASSNSRPKSAVIMSAGIKSSSNTAVSPLLTPSVVNWNKTALEILLSQPPPSLTIDGVKGKSNSDSNKRAVDPFKIDDELMFVPNNCVDDYYVVL